MRWPMCWPISGGGRRRLTYFEALTAAAFCLFAQERADISIIEVGAGGATDATNVMKPAGGVRGDADQPRS